MAFATIFYKNQQLHRSQENPPVNIKYDERTLVSLTAPGQEAVLKCENKLLLYDVEVGKNTTLLTYNKKVEDDITVTLGYAVVTIPTVTSTSFTFNGSPQGPTVTGYDPTYMVQSGTVQATNAGNYTITYSLINKNDYVWSDGTQTDKVFSWSIATMSLVPPTLSGTFTYNGTVQQPIVSGYNATWMNQTGDISATNAGTYSITYSLKEPANTVWSTGGVADITRNWTIATLSLTPPTLSGTYTYNGSQQTVTASGYNATWMNRTGDYQATNAGTYYVTYSLKEPTNTVWTTGGTADITREWTINQQQLATPTQSGKVVYDGTVKTPTWNNYDSTKMSISGTTSAIEIGTYTVTFTITNNNYKFSTGSTATATWAISAAAPQLGIATAKPSRGNSLSFTVLGQPQAYIAFMSTNNGTSTSASVVYVANDGTNQQWIPVKPNGITSSYTTGATTTYSGTTFTINVPRGNNFFAQNYQLVYAYNGVPTVQRATSSVTATTNLNMLFSGITAAPVIASSVWTSTSSATSTANKAIFIVKNGTTNIIARQRKNNFNVMTDANARVVNFHSGNNTVHVNTNTNGYTYEANRTFTFTAWEDGEF